MVHEQRPPQLSPSGAQLLSQALARRNAVPGGAVDATDAVSRHATPTARANAVRRSRDSLRSKPVIDVFDVRADPVSEEQAAVDATRSRLLSVLLGGMALGAIVVGLTLALSALWSEPGVEVAGAVEDRQGETPETAKGLLPVDFDAGSVAVTISDVRPSLDGVRSFALGLESVSADREIRTDEFTVVVEQADTTPVLTFVRFEAEYLQVGSTAAATVRTEGGNDGQLFVVVQLGSLLIDRIAVP